MKYPYEEMQPQPVQEEKHHTALFVIIGVLILIAAAVFFLLKPSGAGEADITEFIAEKELSANVVFASSIDDNFDYELQPNAEYEAGSPVYIYAEALDITYDGSVDVTEDIEITDSDGKSLFTQKSFGSVKKTSDLALSAARFRNVIPTADWEAGDYFLRIKINDNIAEKSITKNLEFKITEKEAKGIDQTADLTGIAAGDASQVKLVRLQKVWGPDNKIIEELTYTQNITTDLTGLDLSSISTQFKMPERFDAGVYLVEIRYTNAATGQSVAVKEPVTVVKELSIDIFSFASVVYDDYTHEIQPNSVYSLGQTVYVYIRLVDFEQKIADGGYNVKFAEDVSVTDESGNAVASQQNYLTVDDTNELKLDDYNIKNVFATGGLSAGKYTYKATVKDLNSGQEAVREEVFHLK